MQSIESIIWNWTVRKGVLAVVIVLGGLVFVNGQMVGSRGGVNQGHFQGQGFENYSHMGQPNHQSPPANDRLIEYVTIDADVELRLKPDQIRIILGIAERAETSTECEQKVFAKIEQLNAAFQELGVAESDIVDDFIAILPRYRFDLETMQGQNVAVEKLDGYNIQSNLHVKVANEKEAMNVIRAAFKLGVANLIGVDYWSKELEETKKKAFEQAVADAKSKAKFLLGETFDQLPTPINVTENTHVIMPDGLYASFANSYDSEITNTYHRDRNVPVVKMFRPKNTYYKGHFEDAGRVPDEIAMSPEIHIVSSVSLFYATPVAKEYRELAGALE